MRYLTPFGYFEKINLENERSLRFVLTDKCNMACEFCIYRNNNFKNSEIKTEHLVDMKLSQNLIELCSYMRSTFGYDTIHFTGGEPTMCTDISDIANYLKLNGFHINIVTNLKKDDLILNLCRNGLIDELTFSFIPQDLNTLRKEIIPGYLTSDSDRNKLQIDSIEKILQAVPSLKVKSNIICSGFTNIESTVNFLNWCFIRGIEPRLQRDRSDARIEESTKCVTEILRILNMHPVILTMRVPGATEVLSFSNSQDHSLFVKVFNQNFRFESICNRCQQILSCKKALSSIRVFSRQDTPVLSFCNQLDIPNLSTYSLPVLEKNIPLLNEIYTLRNNKNYYFEKFCAIQNHQ